MDENISKYSNQFESVIQDGLNDGISLTKLKTMFNQIHKTIKDTNIRPQIKYKKKTKYIRPAIWISDSSDNE